MKSLVGKVGLVKLSAVIALWCAKDVSAGCFGLGEGATK